MDESFLESEVVVPAVPNPFLNEAPWTLYELFKAGVVSFFLLPARLFTLGWCGAIMVAIVRVGTLGTSMKEDRGCVFHTQPFAAWRRWLLAPLAPVNRLAMVACGFWPGSIRVNDLRKSREGGRPANLLVVAPHMTFLDSLVLAVAFPPVPSGVGMSGILDYPVMRSLVLAAQAILVDRSNRESKQSCKEVLASRAGATWTGPPVMVFPEGVITNGTALVQFKLGAFSAGEPVTPVCLRYRWRHYNPSGCGKNHNIAFAIVRMLLQFANFCDIDILDTYYPSETERTDPELFACNVRRLMADHLGAGTTEHSYEDAFLAYDSKAHVGSDWEIYPLKKSHKLTVDDLRVVLQAFEVLDARSVGAITFEELLPPLQVEWLGQKRSRSAAAQLFSFLDQDRSGRLEFREFLQAALLLSGRVCSSGQTRRKFAFLFCDIAGRGRVPSSLMEQLLGSSGSKAQTGSPVGELDFSHFVELVEGRQDVLDTILASLCGCLGISHLAGKEALTS